MACKPPGKTAEFLPLSRGLLLHCQILLLILSSQSREHPEGFDRPLGRGQEIPEKLRQKYHSRELLGVLDNPWVSN